jgi:hypothetical protein
MTATRPAAPLRATAWVGRPWAPVAEADAGLGMAASARPQRGLRPLRVRPVARRPLAWDREAVVEVWHRNPSHVVYSKCKACELR